MGNTGYIHDPAPEGSETPPDCATCGRQHGVGGYNPRHPYRAPGDPVGPLNAKARDDDKPSVRVSRFPSDPVLRQALIDKGVLTPGDLRDAEDKIAAITGIMVEELTGGGKPYVHTHEYDDTPEVVNNDGSTHSGGWGRVRSAAPPS